MRIFRYALLMTALMMVLAACGSNQPTNNQMTEPTGETMMEPTGETMMEPTGETMMEPTGETMMEPTSETMMEPTSETMMEPTGDAMMHDQVAWMSIPLTNALTGEQFTLGDFAGKPVYVEPMATWCHNCRAQLTNVQQAVTQEQGAVFVALSVETDLPVAQLASYAKDNGFDLIFAVASPEILKALSDTFGRTITNPPSTPHFIIAADGSHSELMTGTSSAEQIAQLLQAAGMES